STIMSPVTLEGKGAAFEAVIGRAVVYDHLYNDRGHATIHSTNGMGFSPYSVDVAFTVTFPQGYQEGVVAVYEANGGLSSDPTAAVITKVLLNPASGVVNGPQACPGSVRSPDYWNKFISNPPNIMRAEQVYCANLKGNWTQQSLVVAHEITGGGPTFTSVFVFDKITSDHPVLLFSSRHMLHGEAQISAINSLMIAYADPNSFVNSGKSDINLVKDVSAEYAWFESRSDFELVPFPGIFPDLARYQAEQAQLAVNQGHQSWRNDPEMVARSLATTLLKWSPNSQTTLISGGSGLVEAQVRVRSESPGHPTINVMLGHLDMNTHNIWEVTDVDNSVQQMISNPTGATLVESPLAVTGSGSAFEGDVGTVYLYDRFYNVIGQAKCAPATGMGYTTFTATIHYNSSLPGGVQQGILAYYTRSMADGSISGVVMHSALIS
ncbi:MAG TPA: Gmad2 immunoglobulin-like domain-containing protein, partial [Ktedonobacteraceae bacterium]|nr:Gmad2 immunoglobulin-like domain-containing protein [Ktedonobacteraceae bacterium]